MDFEGKRINLGPAGTGLVYIFRSVFKALGLTDKVKLSYLNHEGAAQGLKDGQIDVVVSPGGPYVSPAVIEISRSVPIRIVEPTSEEEKKIEPLLPYLKVALIPPNKAPGERAEQPRRAYFYSTYWIALASMPDSVIYDILSFTNEPKNKELLSKVINLWEDSGPDFAVVAKIGIPLHPGAVKFWEKKGAKPPQGILK
jgi:TRAP transporter TAXI family solute receptor